jgi:hypothetical protein
MNETTVVIFGFKGKKTTVVILGSCGYITVVIYDSNTRLQMSFMFVKFQSAFHYFVFGCKSVSGK